MNVWSVNIECPFKEYSSRSPMTLQVDSRFFHVSNKQHYGKILEIR
ncbi:hypothetical protein MANES_06G068750v8 [Manihot esculenta]|uniref:Uncharacterized protein n=1 Tax=Manihot esculenta TaxID=3983 RepID=A0ACB7HJU1_MANES|nr:hypothetical protein MANES_06G068750v8 [Manihot esculenta]